MWDVTSGVMLWKLNSCWGDVCWQLYDCFLEPNAAYWFTRRALEPVHVQMNADTRTVCVVNSTSSIFGGSVRIRILGLDGESLYEDLRPVLTPPDSYSEFGAVPVPRLLQGEYFIRLELLTKEDAVVSDNIYWRYSQHPSFWQLMHIPAAELEAKTDWELHDGVWNGSVRLENKSRTVSFFRHLQLADENGNIIPFVDWSDNFITLFPGETCTVSVAAVSGTEPVLIME
jgi:hypothetical protein